MPLTYWIEALHTTTCLLNWLPSKPIHRVIPFQSLFQTLLLYSHLCVFGCLCYPNTSATMSHKLSPRSLPRVFLDYPPNHKGYHCLDLSSHRIFISRHVTFDESTFSFASPPNPPPFDDYNFLLELSPSSSIPLVKPPSMYALPRPYSLPQSPLLAFVVPSLTLLCSYTLGEIAPHTFFYMLMT